jgi:hypothetical protein
LVEILVYDVWVERGFFEEECDCWKFFFIFGIEKLGNNDWDGSGLMEMTRFDCGCFRSRVRCLLKDMGDYKRARLVEECRGYVGEFVFFDLGVKEWYMDGTICVNRMVNSSLVKLMEDEDNVDGLLYGKEVSGVGMQPLGPFFDMSARQAQRFSYSKECECVDEDFLRMQREYLLRVDCFCRFCALDDRCGSSAYEMLWLYDEIFRYVGSSLQEVCSSGGKGNIG